MPKPPDGRTGFCFRLYVMKHYDGCRGRGLVNASKVKIKLNRGAEHFNFSTAQRTSCNVVGRKYASAQITTSEVAVAGDPRATANLLHYDDAIGARHTTSSLARLSSLAPLHPTHQHFPTYPN
jgi:hypothetical protein